MKIVLIFDTIEYGNCLEEVFIFQTKKQLKKILSPYKYNLDRGYTDYTIIDLSIYDNKNIHQVY